jgi:hypothetical protein
MRPSLLVLGLWLAVAGCVRLRTDPEPAPEAAVRRDLPPPPPRLDGPLDVHRSVELASSTTCESEFTLAPESIRA